MVNQLQINKKKKFQLQNQILIKNLTRSTKWNLKSKHRRKNWVSIKKLQQSQNQARPNCKNKWEKAQLQRMIKKQLNKSKAWPKRKPIPQRKLKLFQNSKMFNYFKPKMTHRFRISFRDYNRLLSHRDFKQSNIKFNCQFLHFEDKKIYYLS